MKTQRNNRYISNVARAVAWRSRAAWLVIACAGIAPIAACSKQAAAPASAERLNGSTDQSAMGTGTDDVPTVSKSLNPKPPSVPLSGESIRVGGDLTAAVSRRGEDYVFERCAITTPLPAGYPVPTPPGAIDIKSYPVVRRAEASGSMNPDLGMNFAFFPLFQHIKKREIAMTSPVEMDYNGIEPGDTDGVDSWTMSFLYRTTDLGPAGQYGDIVVQDTAPMTVISIGGRGSYAISTVKKRIAELYSWIDTHPEWERAGEPRGLFYNGPEQRSKDKWYEVQVPIKTKPIQ